MKRVLNRGAAALLLLALLPATAFAQASISGIVKDTSGAVLPGVTVEAASPVLIEKTRSTVTDGSGAYQIINLQPGTYTVTFTLPGFNTFVRDQIELTPFRPAASASTSPPCNRASSSERVAASVRPTPTH